MKTSKLWSGIGNFTLILLSVYASITLYQRWVSKDARESQAAPSFSALTLTNSQIELPLKDDQPSILVFWATWCGPCELELDRLKKLIDDKEIPADRVFAVSIGESLETVQDTQRKRNYPFQIIADEKGKSGSLYQVRVTPTVVHVGKDQKMAWVAEGLHPLSGKRAKDLFEN